MNTQSRSALWWTSTAALLVMVVVLHSYHFRGWNFHTDEIDTVHAAQTLDASGVTLWMSKDAAHPAGWVLLATSWVDLVGIQEPVVRYFSTLCTLVALALIFRLGSDLFDRPTGLYAAFLIGTIPFTLYFMHEFRPYALLALVTVGAQWALLRWLIAPNFKHALLFVLFGLAAVQTHYYGTYAILSLAVTFVVVARWDRGLYLRGVGLFAAVGLSLLSWILPILSKVVTKSGKEYADPSNWPTLVKLYRQMEIAPAGIGHFLLLVGLAGVGGLVLARRETPGYVGRRFRFGEGWRVLYLLLPPAGLLGIALVSNLAINNLTPRNLIGIVPALALVAAYGLRRLSWQAQAVVLLIIAYSAWTEFHPFRVVQPYREVVAALSPDYEPGDLVVLDCPEVTSFYYTLQDRLPGPIHREQLFLIGNAPYLNVPDLAPHRVWTNDAAAVQDFARFLGTAGRVWVVEGRDGEFFTPFAAILDEHYSATRTIAVASGDPPLVIIQYDRR